MDISNPRGHSKKKSKDLFDQKITKRVVAAMPIAH
jgi:hypothetical protein